MIPIIPMTIRISSFLKPVPLRQRWRAHAGRLLLLPVAAAVMTLSSCEDESAKKQAPQITVDTNPVGAGLSVIGFGLVGAAVVGALGRMLR
jgi:hypothetical protein